MKRHEETSEILFDLHDETEWIDALKSLFKETEIGQEYRRDFYIRENSQEDADKLLDAVEILSPREDGHATINQLSAALRNLILSGALQPKDKEEEEPLEAPVLDTRPRTKNGDLMNESQLRYREYREWSEQASAAEVNLRRRSDPGYASYVIKAMQEEMRSTPVGDGAENLNANRQPQNSGVPADVRTYATRYRTMSASDVRKELSPGMNPLGPAAAKEANRLFEAAVADGLI
jgi:hypothetical protein